MLHVFFAHTWSSHVISWFEYWRCFKVMNFFKYLSHMRIIEIKLQKYWRCLGTTHQSSCTTQNMRFYQILLDFEFYFFKISYLFFFWRVISSVMSHIFTLFSLLQRATLCHLENFLQTLWLCARYLKEPSNLVLCVSKKIVTVRLINRIMLQIKWKIWDFEKMKPKIEVEYFNKTLCFELLKLFSKDSVKLFYGIRIMFKVSERYT